MVVIIPTRNRPELLARTLESLASARRSGNLRLIVVEAGGAGPAGSVAARFRGVLDMECLAVPSPAKSAALNAALAQCRDADLVVFFDDDVRVEPAVLDAYAAASASASELSYFGGPTGADWEAAPPAWLRDLLPTSATGFRWSDPEKPVAPPSFFLGFNWAARAHDLKRCGGFPVEFGPGTSRGTGEESILQYRLWQAGLRGRFVPRAMVWHYVPRERSTAGWALGRMRTGGFLAGMFEAADDAGRPAAGLARALARRLRPQFTPRRLAQLAVLRPAGRFWARRLVRWTAGFREGYRQERREGRLRGEGHPA